MIKKVMETNYFLSQVKLKRLSQSIWFKLNHVLQLLIVIVGLGFFFLLILMNKQINTISIIYFLLQNCHIFFFTLHPSAPLLPTVLVNCTFLFI